MYTLTDKEISQISIDFDEHLGPLFLKRLAKDNDRNLLIIKKLMSIPKGKPTLVYACTVEQAHFLSVILTSEGRPAGAISSGVADSPQIGNRSSPFNTIALFNKLSYIAETALWGKCYKLVE